MSFDYIVPLLGRDVIGRIAPLQKTEHTSATDSPPRLDLYAHENGLL